MRLFLWNESFGLQRLPSPRGRAGLSVMCISIAYHSAVLSTHCSRELADRVGDLFAFCHV